MISPSSSVITLVGRRPENPKRFEALEAIARLNLLLGQAALDGGHARHEHGWHSIIGSDWRRYEAFVGPSHVVVARAVVPAHIPIEDAQRIGCVLLCWELEELRASPKANVQRKRLTAGPAKWWAPRRAPRTWP